MSLPTRHVPFGRLADYVERRLSADDQAEVHAHLTACAHCADEAARLEQLVGHMRADTAEPPPAYVAARAVRLFRQRVARQPGLARRVLASLSFDSRQAPLAPGLRAGPLAARQLLFSADDYAVDLRLTPAGATWTLAGQVLGPSAAGSVELHGPISARADLNQLSEFLVPALPPGSYTLTLRLDDTEIAIDGLTVESDGPSG